MVVVGSVWDVVAFGVWCGVVGMTMLLTYLLLTKQIKE